MKKKLFLLFFALLLATIVLLKLTHFQFNAQNIANQNKLIIFLIVTLAGLIDSINLCAISILFISLSFFAGLGNFRQKIITLGFWYILGIYLSYFLIGIGILKTLGSIGVPTVIFLKVFAIVLILLAINELLRQFKPESSVKLGIPNFVKPKLAKLIQKGSAPASFTLGLLVSLLEFPCTGGPYLFVLSLLQAKTTFTTGLAYLFYYNFLFVSPLILILYLAYQLQDLNKIQEKNKMLRKYSNFLTPIILIILGVLILFFYK